MRWPLNALLAALVGIALGLSACATLTSPVNCQRALTGLSAASDIVAALEANGIAPEIAAKLGPLLALGKIGVGAACGR